MCPLFWDLPLYEESSDSDGSENEANIKTSQERRKSDESKDISCSGGKREKVESGKIKGSTATKESKGGAGSENNKDEKAREKREDGETCEDRIVSEDCEGKAHLSTSPVVSKRKQSTCFSCR